jgi:malate synthase
MQAPYKPPQGIMEDVASGFNLRASQVEGADQVLTPPALRLLEDLHRRFEPRRQELLRARQRRQGGIDAGVFPDFLPNTKEIRAGNWHVEPAPADLQDRRLEITGPTDRKMVINALNAPVSAFMADFEDACSPTWDNILRGQMNLRDAVAHTIEYVEPTSGRIYHLNKRIATLIVRPRGWHLPEKHVRIDGTAVSGALFDFTIYLVNNYEELARRGTGPYFYLPKLENHYEARLWNEVFLAAQDALGLKHGTIKVTVLIETILAAFEMDEILYELREHIVGLNCGRWDYIFSVIKKFWRWPQYLLPDRATVGMDRHFLKSYVALLIKTAHQRGAHAMGGMAAQIPIRHDAAANASAMERVRADKLREVQAGHDGTWIAHPGLATVAREPFDAFMSGPNQLSISRAEVHVSATDLLQVPDGKISEPGMRTCIRVGVQYLEAWLRGSGCVPLYHLMEDAATAEICRAQLWQWIHHGACTSDGQPITLERFDRLLSEELDGIRAALQDDHGTGNRLSTAARLFDEMTKQKTFEEFLTLRAYEHLA